MRLEDATGPRFCRVPKRKGEFLCWGKEGLALRMEWDVACPIHHARKNILVCRHCKSEWFVYMQRTVQALRAESLSVTFSLSFPITAM